MQKNRCTVPFCWMAERSEFIRPVNVFPSAERCLHCLGWPPQGLLAYRRSMSLQTTLTLPITFWLLTVLFVCAAKQPHNSVAEIRSVLTAQQNAWNRGDIDSFMNGYARSPSTVFVSEDEVRCGWETVRERYRVKYSDRAKMGTLSFSEIEITMLSPDAAVVLGRWRLSAQTMSRMDGSHSSSNACPKAGGLFTIIRPRLCRPSDWLHTLPRYVASLCNVVTLLALLAL
jgi:ketosteroid isomerase-like protein